MPTKSFKYAPIAFRTGCCMDYGKILLTGGSGALGRHITGSGRFKNLPSPSHDEMDITDTDSIGKFFNTHAFDAIIHCAAMARVGECEKSPNKALATNTIGTANLVMAAMKKEEQLQKSIRFIHISTDGVYQSTEGNYSEDDATIPYNVYGWTKLGAESAVNLLRNFCIIRTRFFNPEKIKYDKYATDSYTSMIPVGELAQAIAIALESSFAGTINIGGERKSDYDMLRKYKPTIKPCKFDDIQSKTPFRLSKDASMNISLWKKLKGKEEIKA